MSNNKLLILVSVLTAILIISFSAVLISCTAQDEKVIKRQEPVEEIEVEKEETAEEIAVEESIPDKSDYLNIADVEKVSGVQGVQLVDYDPSIGAGGDINFALSDTPCFYLLKSNQNLYLMNGEK